MAKSRAKKSPTEIESGVFVYNTPLGELRIDLTQNAHAAARLLLEFLKAENQFKSARTQRDRQSAIFRIVHALADFMGDEQPERPIHLRRFATLKALQDALEDAAHGYPAGVMQSPMRRGRSIYLSSYDRRVRGWASAWVQRLKSSGLTLARARAEVSALMNRQGIRGGKRRSDGTPPKITGELLRKWSADIARPPDNFRWAFFDTTIDADAGATLSEIKAAMARSAKELKAAEKWLLSPDLMDRD